MSWERIQLQHVRFPLATAECRSCFLLFGQNRASVRRHRAHRVGQSKAALLHRSGRGHVPLHTQLPANLQASPAWWLQSECLIRYFHSSLLLRDLKQETNVKRKTSESHTSLSLTGPETSLSDSVLFCIFCHILSNIRHWVIKWPTDKLQ